MPPLQWDQVGDRLYETGVDRGVLYTLDSSGAYASGVVWNGLTTVTEKPTGAGATPQFADNIKYLNLIAAESFGATVQAFTYPDEFAECDGTAVPHPGVRVGQQGRKVFGLCYRTRLGNDVEGTDFGYRLHMVWGAQASPSDKAYSTINDSPAAIDFSWDLSTTPLPVAGHSELKATSLVVVDSSVVDPADLTALEDALYGGAASTAHLPLPGAVIDMFTTGP
jgi:hypothetical protein